MLSHYHIEDPRHTSLPLELVKLGRQPLLVVCAYEGTLAPSAAEPAPPRTRNALAALIGHPRHQVALLSSLPKQQIEDALDLPSLSIAGFHQLQRPDKPIGSGKAVALEHLINQHPLYHPVFIAQDATNEEAFLLLELLGGTSIKVGKGQSQATVQLNGPDTVMDLLEIWVQFSR